MANTFFKTSTFLGVSSLALFFATSTASAELDQTHEALNNLYEGQTAIESVVRVNAYGSGNILEAHGREFVLTAAHIIHRPDGARYLYPDYSNFQTMSEQEEEYRREFHQSGSKTFLFSNHFYVMIEDPDGGAVLARQIGSIHNMRGRGNAGDLDVQPLYDLALLEIVDENHPVVSHVQGLLDDFPEHYGVERQGVSIDGAVDFEIPITGQYSLSGFPSSHDVQIALSGQFQYQANPSLNGEHIIELNGNTGENERLLAPEASGSVAFMGNVPISVQSRMGRCEPRWNYGLSSPAYPAIHFLTYIYPRIQEMGYELAVGMRPITYERVPSNWQYDLMQDGHLVPSADIDSLLEDIGVSRMPVDQRIHSESDIEAQVSATWCDDKDAVRLDIP